MSKHHAQVERVGYEFPQNRPWNKDWAGQLAVRRTIRQDFRHVDPSYIDVGDFDPSADQVFGTASHVSFGAQDETTRTILAGRKYSQVAQQQITETDALHRHFGWEAPADTASAAKVAKSILRLAGTYLDFGAYQNRTRVVSCEMIRTTLPIDQASRYSWDEVLHTDSVDPLWPVAQVFYANVRHTRISRSRSLIGEGQESLLGVSIPGNFYDGTNVVYTERIPREESLTDGHLILADAKSLPHGRPDLSRSLDLGEPTTRNFLRAYISPVRLPNEAYEDAMTLQDQAEYYGLSLAPRL